MQRVSRRPLGRYRYVRLRWRVAFAIVDFLGGALFATVRVAADRCARAARRFGLPAAEPSRRPNDPQVILLVQLDHLGDAILSTPLLAALRRRYPWASIEVLASLSNRDVFEATAEVDRVYVSRRNRFARGFRIPLAWIATTLWWGLWLRRRRIDLGIDVRGEFPHALLLWLSGARRRLGWSCGGGGFLLTDSAEYVPNRPEVASALPRFRPGDAARRSIRSQLAELDQRHPRPELRVVIHVGAGTPAKQWPIEHWRELIARIVVKYGGQVVLVGSPADRIIARDILTGKGVAYLLCEAPGTDGPTFGWCPLVRPFRQKVPDPFSLAGVADWTGRLRLVELAALLEECDLLVGADSGPAHLAAAVGARAVVLFSGTNEPRQWQPYGDRLRVIRHEVACRPCHRQVCRWADHPCMKGLRPERVMAAIEPWLAEVAERREICREGVGS
jgi:heptosyltransferase-2